VYSIDSTHLLGGLEAYTVLKSSDKGVGRNLEQFMKKVLRIFIKQTFDPHPDLHPDLHLFKFFIRILIEILNTG